jgi:hypothetical protein
MNSSAALPASVPTHTPEGGTAEVHALNSEEPRLGDCSAGRGGHEYPSPRKVPDGEQRTRPRSADHDHCPTRREDHHDHSPRRRWEEVTAAVERPTVNVEALEADLRGVLTAHGLDVLDHATVRVDVMTRAGVPSGIAFHGRAHTNPFNDLSQQGQEVAS